MQVVMKEEGLGDKIGRDIFYYTFNYVLIKLKF